MPFASARSRWGWTVLSVVSGLLIAYTAWHLLDPSVVHRVTDAGVGIFTAAVLVGALVLTANWPTRHDTDVDAGVIFCRWFLGGVVVIGASGIVTIGIETARGLAIVEPLFTGALWMMGGGIVGLFIGYLDVRRLAARDRAEDAREDAKRLAERLSVLNRVLRHDVRTDLNLVLGYADELDGRFDESPAELDSLRERASRLVSVATEARTIEDLLAEEESRTLRVGELLADRLAEARRTHPDVEFRADIDTDVTVVGHPLVERAVDAIVETAVESTSAEGSAISLTCERVDAEWAAVAVGGDENVVPSTEQIAFEDTEETPLQHADGIRLWTVKWAVEESAGDVRVEDTDEGGHRLVLELPLDNGGLVDT